LGKTCSFYEIILNTRIQRCNFWGTNCAGGPSEARQDTVAFSIDSSTNLIQIESKAKFKLRSSKLGNRFSSCNLTIRLYGEDSTGKRFEGYLGLIHDNDRDTCESAEATISKIQEILKVPEKIFFLSDFN
jgi:hypothetical protein